MEFTVQQITSLSICFRFNSSCAVYVFDCRYYCL